MPKRKHFKQMSPREKEVLRGAVDSLGISELKHFGSHSLERLVQKRINALDVLNAVKFGSIIEAHRKVADDIRVLLRQPTKRGSSVCVVVSLKDGRIVTAYENDNQDKHFTIDWSEYKWRADLVLEVKLFMQNKRRRKRHGGANHSHIL